MMLTMFHSKLHRATVTKVNKDYEGSLGIDRALIAQAGLLPGQQIDVLNINNGERFTTYVIEEPEGSRDICIYGAAAHKANIGDLVIIIAYAQMTEAEARAWQPTVLVLDEKNNVKARHG